MISSPPNAAPCLTGSDAVAALIQLEDGRYLMQHRDDLPSIWYPGCWGCFGGAVNAGEDPLDALRRELIEEIEVAPRDTTYFTRFDFDLTELGMGRYYRIYYLVRMTEIERRRVVLHEGQAVDAISGEALLGGMRLVPYDAFALFLYHDRRRLGGGWIRETGPSRP